MTDLWVVCYFNQNLGSLEMKLRMFAAAVLALGAVSNANAEVQLLDLTPL